jgi:hypothetical protein
MLKVVNEKPDSEIAPPNNVWVPGLEDKEKEAVNDKDK